MIRTCRVFSPFIAMALFAAVARPAVIRAQDERPDVSALPRLESLAVPSLVAIKEADAKDKAFDWIVLKTDNAVIVCNPLYPRPDTLKKIEEERKQLEALKPNSAEEREKRSARLEELKRVTLTLPGDTAEYKIPPSQIDQIILFEDLVLQRVDQLLDAGEIRSAYDLILMVEREIPNWEKTRPRFERLLLTESKIRGDAGDIYASLALLDELAALNINNPDLQPRFGEIVGQMIAEAAKDGDYRKARFLMGRIERHFPQHPESTAWREKLSQQSAAKLGEAVQAAQEKNFAQASLLAQEADRIWPTTGNARATFAQLTARYQVLRVAVESFSGEKKIFPVINEAVVRHQELVSVPMFEASAVDELTYYRSSFFERWDPSDLGREVTLTLRDTRPHWQSQPVLTANQIADALGLQLNPESPLFNARLASFVREFSVRSPTEIKLSFMRVPLTMEALFRFPVITQAGSGVVESAEQATDGSTVGESTSAGAPDSTAENSVGAGDPVVLSTRFQLVKEDATQRIYRRFIPEPNGLDNAQYHVAEVVERRYPDRHQAIQAMNRGEAEFLTSVLPWEIDGFRASETLTAVKKAIPSTHVIIFNPLSKNVGGAQVRRALSMAIDRESILKSVVLRDPQMKHGRPTSSVWRQASYATNPIEQTPPYDIRLAYALRFAAERQLQIAELQRLEPAAREKAKAAGEEFKSELFRASTNVDYIKLPSLRMIVAPDPVSKAAAERINVYWEKIGLQVQLIDGSQSGEPAPDSDWDMMYRQVSMEEPLLDLWPLLTNDPQMDVLRLESFPDWMRQELINLDYAGSFIDAQRRLNDIHRHIAAQAFVIPLWEVDDYLVFQKTVSGYSAAPLSTYQNVERWTVRP